MPACLKALCFAIAIAVLGSGLAAAQDFALTVEDYKALPPKAQEEYRDGINYLDHVREAMALKSFVRAAEAAPKSIEIRFLVGKLAEWVGRKATQDEAVESFEIAKKAYQEITAMGVDAIGRPTVRRAENRLQQVEKLIAQQPETDAKREKIGGQVLQSHLKDIGYNIKK